MTMTKLFALAASIPWAIEAPWLRTVLKIANREGDGPAAVSAQLGRPLENTQAVEMRDGVAVISLIGPIFPRANLFTEVSGATSIAIAARDFYSALNNPQVSAILLNIDSPGGDVTGVSEFADMIASARGIKPVHAYVGGLGASAAYWLASAAEQITIDKTARVGSIGVVMAMPNPDASTAEEIEIVSSQSPNKRPNVATEEGRATVQETVDALAEVFVDAVARNRDVKPSKVLSDFGRGGVLVGKAAVAAGMANKTGSYEGALKALRTAARKPPEKKRMSSEDNGGEIVATETEQKNADVEALLTAAGETSVIRAVGVIETARAQASRVPALEAELAELKAKIDAQEHASLLTALRSEGKLTAHMEKLASKMTIEQLRGFAVDAEPIPALVASKTEEPAVGGEGGVAGGGVVATHNGKTYDDMRPGERASLKTDNPALYEAMRAEYRQRTGKK